MPTERETAARGSERSPEVDTESERVPPQNTDDTERPADALPDCYCPVSGILETLGRKYAIPVVCAVGAHGTARFSDVESDLPGASTSTLSARLSELETEGVVTRTQYDEIPPRVEYELTEEGRELLGRLEPLLEWVDERT